MKAVITIVAIALLAGAAYVFFWDKPEPVVGPPPPTSYAYQCDTFNFSLLIPDDLSSVTLVPAQGAPFFRTVLNASAGAHARFEGGGVTLTGAGEEVTIQSDAGTYVCYPLPSSDKAPWNWGDPGEGGGTRPDLALIVSESILGVWRSREDPEFERVFVSGGVVIDSHGETQTRGQWEVFTDTSLISVPFPLAPNTAYIRMTLEDLPEEILHFSVSALTPESLELMYLDRGGALQFERVPEM